MFHALNVFLEAGSPESDSRLQKLSTDPSICADTMEYIVRYAANGIANVGDFVRKANF
jgi:hypothetical protein